MAATGSMADLLREFLSGIGPGAEMDEALCKGDDVQAEMAELMGSMASFAIMPSRWSFFCSSSVLSGAFRFCRVGCARGTEHIAS